MENTSEKKDKNSVKKPLKHICIGLVAHVDAGKTTLSEGMLYLSGQIRNMGRVDHGDTFLDNYETERERGITIFSKQAEFIWNDTSITILDTPGHVDFSAEMERVLQVLDCAVLVVSAVDGVQAHTVTLWRLLKQYKIPTMIFVNKMDRQEADREKLLEELKNRFGDGCVEMDMQSEENKESLAMCDETMLEEYLSGGKIEKETVKKAVAARKVFPCWFGSALKAQGIEALMSGLCEYAPSAEPLPEFGAKVYKIARDPQGNRLRRTIELTQEELDAIYVRTPDPVKKTKRSAPVTVTAGKAAAFCNGDRLQSRNVPFDISGDYTKTKKKKADRKEYLLVDGYNIIFAWDSLKELAKIDLAAARGKLADILCNYQGYKQCELILVFDAYKVEGNPGEIMKYHNIHVVYTREAETADHYIEKTVRRIAKEHDVIVATSDALEQVIIMGQGAHRMSAAGLKEEIESVIEQMKDDYPKQEELIRNYLFDYLEKDIAEEMERVRLGSHKKKWTV